MVKTILDKLNTTSKSESSKLNKEHSKLGKRLNSIDTLFAKLYEDRLAQAISERNYKMMLGKYQKEQEQISAQINAILEELQSSEENQINVKMFTSMIKDYAGIKELTAPLLNRLIDKITVGEAKIADGERIQTITIYYNFVGRIKQ